MKGFINFGIGVIVGSWLLCKLEDWMVYKHGSEVTIRDTDGPMFEGLLYISKEPTKAGNKVVIGMVHDKEDK